MTGHRIHAFVLALVVAASASAMDTPKPEPKDPDKKDAQLEQARAAIGRQDWTGAQAILRQAVAREPANADLHNLYAYSMRKGPQPALDLVFRHYNEALRIDPQHRGAHEYIGRSYLLLGQEDKAREHLAHLERTCMGACPERDSLRAAITEGWPWRNGVRVGQRSY